MWTFFLYYFAAIGLLMQVFGLVMVGMILHHERDVRRQPKMTEMAHAA